MNKQIKEKFEHLERQIKENDIKYINLKIDVDQVERIANKIHKHCQLCRLPIIEVNSYYHPLSSDEWRLSVCKNCLREEGIKKVSLNLSEKSRKNK